MKHTGKFGFQPWQNNGHWIYFYTTKMINLDKMHKTTALSRRTIDSPGLWSLREGQYSRWSLHFPTFLPVKIFSPMARGNRVQTVNSCVVRFRKQRLEFEAPETIRICEAGYQESRHLSREGTHKYA